MALSLTSPFRTATEVLLMRCFGAQAMLVGLSWCTLKPTKQAFTCFGLSMLPFFYFNYWAIARSRLFTRSRRWHMLCTAIADSCIVTATWA
ncbi:hypothetical protein SeMB42_g06497 [Synchytrium endobioticum]|nr:hypothetical protein SeMB42_g06497 [Synchytrium endobioticum]